MAFNIDDFAKQVEADLRAVNPAWATYPFGTEAGILEQDDQIYKEGGSIFYFYVDTRDGQQIRNTAVLRFLDGEPLDDLGSMPILPDPDPPPSGGGGASLYIGHVTPDEADGYVFWWDDVDGELRVFYDDGDSKQWVDIHKPAGSIDSDIHIGPLEPTNRTDTPLWWDTEKGELRIFYNDGDTQQWVDVAPENIQSGDTVAVLNVIDFAEGLKQHGTVSGSITLEFADGGTHSLTCGGDLTINIGTCPTGYAKSIQMIINEAGLNTITWGASIVFVKGIDPIMSHNRDRMIFFTEDGGVTVDAVWAQGNYPL